MICFACGSLCSIYGKFISIKNIYHVQKRCSESSLSRFCVILVRYSFRDNRWRFPIKPSAQHFCQFPAALAWRRSFQNASISDMVFLAEPIFLFLFLFLFFFFFLLPLLMAVLLARFAPKLDFCSARSKYFVGSASSMRKASQATFRWSSVTFSQVAQRLAYKNESLLLKKSVTSLLEGPTPRGCRVCNAKTASSL